VGFLRRKRSDDPPKTTVSVHSEVVDASGAPGLGEEIMQTLKEHGIEPGKGQVIDASSVPGLTEEITKALNQSGVLEHALSGEAPEQADPVAQLAKLAELHKSGVLSDYEFAVAKQKLLDERWHA
jgi:hypothetical protein